MRIVIPNYQKLKVGRVRVVALATCADEIRAILEKRSLYQYAAEREDARTIQGRGPVYAVAFPGACGRVVVRHARRGGLPRHFISDVFLSRLRPIRELITSYTLRLRGVPSPEIVAYAVYPAAGGLLLRYDVASREVEHAADLAEWLGRLNDAGARTAVLEATAVLLAQLSEAGAHHSDLNAKNVLLVPFATGFQALVIDVDRVRFHIQRSPTVMGANIDRLARSLRKLAARGLRLTEGEIGHLGRRARELQQERISIENEIVAASAGREKA